MDGYIMVALIANSVALAIGVIAIIALTVAWMKAEWKIYKLGGKSKWFRDTTTKKETSR